MPRSLAPTLAAGGGVCLALAWFRYLPAPWLGPLLLLGVGSLLLTRSMRTEAAKVMLVCLASVVFALGAVEAFWWHRMHARVPSADYPAGYLRPDGLLGYVPARSSQNVVRHSYKGQLVYNVTYTIDSTGLRVSPPAAVPPPAECVLFFGDSFTFGEGVEDTETMPYRLGVHTQGRYHVYNFALHGYGPHQMLAWLESRRVERMLNCRPRHVIYSVIPDHVVRAAGHRPGGRGPRYGLGAGGVPIRAGNLEDEAGMLSFSDYLRSQFTKSALFNLIEWRVRAGDLELFQAIVSRSRALVREKFPGCSFEVILWTDRGYQPILSGLRAQGMTVHPIDDVFPTYHRDPKQFLIPFDGHPNAPAQDAIAKFVVAKILNAQTP